MIPVEPKHILGGSCVESESPKLGKLASQATRAPQSAITARLSAPTVVSQSNALPERKGAFIFAERP